MNFVASIAWVPRGAAKELPDQVRLAPEELKKLFDASAENADDGEASENAGEDEEWATDEEEAVAELAEDADVEAAEDEEDADEPSTSKGKSFSVSSLAAFPTNDDDPYVTVKDNDDVDSEDEDFKIRPDDNLLAIAHVDEDASILEVYVYNEKDDDLYCHHDVILPSYPLALEWMPFHPAIGEEKGNFVAIGSMDPVIQVWDLDLVNAMEPAFELRSKQKKRKHANMNGAVGKGHSDAVLSLAWNPISQHVIASGSSDQTVVLWDLEEGRPATTLSGFEDKVQAVRWRPHEDGQLLCGSCDKTVRLFDSRTIPSKETVWKVEGEVERLVWATSDNDHFYVATDSGHLSYFDVRQPTQPISTMQAHTKTITGMCLSNKISDLLVTCSEDKKLKVWDVATTNDAPQLIFERKLKMGAMQFASMSPDSPFMVALAGEDSDNNFRVLDLYKISEEIQQRWGSSLPANLKAKYEPAIKPKSVTEPEPRKPRTSNEHFEEYRRINQSAPKNKVVGDGVEVSPRRNREKNKWGKRQGRAEPASKTAAQPTTSLNSSKPTKSKKSKSKKSK